MLNGGINNQRGVALLVTVAFVAMIVTGSLLLSRKVRSAYLYNAAGSQQMKLYQMAVSGVNAAKAMLAKDKKESEIDFLAEDWADPESMAGFLAEIPFEQGDVVVGISDERSRIQVNALVSYPDGHEFNENQRILWDNFLSFIEQNLEDEIIEDSGAIVDAFKDWIDSGDDDAITGLGGAESDYYRELDPPYACGNSPFQHYSEFAMVKGMTQALLEGNDDMPGIGNFMTVFGLSQAGNGKFVYDGRININTAELPVIAALLPPESTDLALAIYEHRQLLMEEEDIASLSQPEWYKNAPGCKDLKINKEMIGVASDLFRIEATASLGELKLTLVSIVERKKEAESGKWVCKVLQQELK